MTILRSTRIVRIIAGVVIGLILLPLGMYIPHPGTRADQAKLRGLIDTMEEMQADCDDPELRELFEFTTHHYRYISRWCVRIVDYGELDIAGMNWPHMPGMNLDRWCWEECDDITLIGLILHEAMHDYYPYFGHNHMIHLVSVNSSTDNAFDRFIESLDPTVGIEPVSPEFVCSEYELIECYPDGSQGYDTE